jgi:hypothetical protein
MVIDKLCLYVPHDLLSVLDVSGEQAIIVSTRPPNMRPRICQPLYISYVPVGSYYSFIDVIRMGSHKY